MPRTGIPPRRKEAFPGPTARVESSRRPALSLDRLASGRRVRPDISIRKRFRMLARLSIRDIVLIERLDIEFSSGLAVLTGETGAGKSILLDAFALALGGRG